MLGFDQTATVYTPNGTDGDFTVTAKTGLACRLAHLSQAAQSPAEERSDPAGRRRLLWDAAYTMPEPAQVVVAGDSGGDRWSIEAQTVEAIRGPYGAVVYRRAAVVRVIS